MPAYALYHCTYTLSVHILTSTAWGRVINLTQVFSWSAAMATPLWSPTKHSVRILSQTPCHRECIDVVVLHALVVAHSVLLKRTLF
jgi:hypothetical protein